MESAEIVTMHVGGAAWEGLPARLYEVMRPGRGTALATVQDATSEDVDIAVSAALSASADWGGLSAPERARLVMALADAIDQAAEELALLDARNGGHPLRWTRLGAAKGADTLRYFAGIALEVGGRTIPATADHLHLTVREPFGVVGVITAYNHPTMFAVARTAAALVAGNSVVLKPAEQTPLSSLAIARIAAGILPAGVFNVVPGRQGTGAALVRHPAVRRINFTGSTSTALRIQADAAASGHLKRLGFQLSGKNPLLVMDDIDVEEAASAAVEGMNVFKVMGQSCGSTSVAFVPRRALEPFLEALRDKLARLAPGDPEDPATEIGALITASHRDQVEAAVEAARAGGARVVAGGSRPSEEHLQGGYFYRPTALADLDHQAPILSHEVFGPVLSLLAWDSEDELLRQVNASRFGLTAAILTHDLDVALRVARGVEAGYVWVNDVEKRWIGVPFGGYKDSGTSTEFAAEELLANMQQKAISIRVGPG